MSALVLPMPDVVLDRAAAREVLRSTDATADQLNMACEVLAASSNWQDINLVRETRNALWSTRASELQPAARALVARLATRSLTSQELRSINVPPPGDRMAQHFEAMNTRATPRRQRVLAWLGFAFIGFALAVAAHVALAAPGKITRTTNLHQQIEETGHE
jgi:hypothetical protein